MVNSLFCEFWVQGSRLMYFNFSFPVFGHKKTEVCTPAFDIIKNEFLNALCIPVIPSEFLKV
jgi:hypothetical protein